jgi:thioredoxin reductase (NADPH)
MEERVNAVVIGAGPAGAASAIFLKRAGFDPLLIHEGEPGGLLREANLVENYPGFPNGIVGSELASLIAEQLQRLEVRMKRTTARRVSVIGQSFQTETDAGTYVSDSLIIATGTSPRKAAIPGTEDVEGSSLFYGVSSLSQEMVWGKRVSILGGGDAAFDYAINLTDKGASVTILSRSNPTCLQLLADRARERGVKIMTSREVTGFTDTPNGVAIAWEGDEGHDETVADTVIVAFGRESRLEFIDDELMSRMTIDDPPGTGVPGLFLIGDVARGRNRQTAIAVGDGVLAAMMVERSLNYRG